jgi:putative CocE/NonD family hydrolase
MENSKTLSMKTDNHLKVLLTSTLLSLLFITTMNGQSIKGNWYGMLNLPQLSLRLTIHIDSASSGYIATFDSPDQGAFGIPTTRFSFVYPDIVVEHKYANFSIEGTVDSRYKVISAVFKQRSTKANMTFGRDSIPAPESSLISIKSKYNKQEVYITMRDGIKLFTSIYTPKDTTRTYPILMNRTPYDAEPGGKDVFSFFLTLYYRFVKENYIMVFQDVRGKFMSEGEYEDIRPFIADKKSSKDIDEASDTYDAVDWLVKNVKNNNGKVGVWGISYPGFYSTMAILSGHPAIKAVSPQAPVTAWFLGDDFHHNGAFFLLDCFSFYYSNGRKFTSQTRSGFRNFRWPGPDNYQFFLDLGPVSNISKKYYGDSIKFWNDATKHINYDDFWKARDPRPFLKNVKPAVMTVGGWFDAEDLYGALHTYQAIEKQNPSGLSNHLVMGPWSHGQWGVGQAENMGNIYWGMDANKSFQELEVKFFDYYLRGVGKEDFPEATIFITGANEWRTFETWPPASVKDQTLYFQSLGKLAFTTPSASESFDEYATDPLKPVPYSEKIHQQRTTEYMNDDQRFASRRPDVMTYTSNVLDEDMTLTGPVSTDLFVSTTGTDADFIVKLIDVFPDTMVTPTDKDLKVTYAGYQMLVRGEVFRGKYRNSFEKPEPFVPGKLAEIKYEMPDVAHTFKKGHRIMIQVQNSWFPLVDSNPQKFVDIYNCSEADFQKATQRIYHDKQHSSHVTVKVLK